MVGAAHHRAANYSPSPARHYRKADGKFAICLICTVEVVTHWAFVSSVFEMFLASFDLHDRHVDGNGEAEETGGSRRCRPPEHRRGVALMDQEERERVLAKIRGDPFGEFTDITPLRIEEGYSLMTMTVGEDMLNFHSLAHEGAVFTLADAASAADNNSYGTKSAALNVNIIYLSAGSGNATAGQG